MLLFFKILLSLLILIFSAGLIASDKKDERMNFTVIVCLAIAALTYTITK
jgi:hypothetical protein